MLNFYDKKIMLDVNIDCETFECLTTGSPICDRFEDLKNIFHEVQLDQFSKIDVEVMLKNKHKQVAMNLSQFYGFISDWFINSSSFKKLIPNWSVKDWLVDYLKSEIRLLESGKMDCGFDYKNDMFTYHEDFALSSLNRDIVKLKNGEIQKESVVIFNGKKQYKPEFSWQVEDFLSNRLSSEKSRYIADIEPVIRANLRNFQFYSGVHNTLNVGTINVPKWLTKLCNKDIIEVNSAEFEEALRQPEGIYLFQTPIMFHASNSNFERIQKLLEIYRNNAK